MRGWKAWYADGSVYSSLELPWSDLPKSGLQIVCVYYRQEYKPGFPYRKTLDGCDWYYLAPNGEIEGVKSDSWNGWRNLPCGVSNHNIKRGTAISDEAFAEITRQADEARQWP